MEVVRDALLRDSSVQAVSVSSERGAVSSAAAKVGAFGMGGIGKTVTGGSDSLKFSSLALLLHSNTYSLLQPTCVVTCGCLVAR